MRLPYSRQSIGPDDVVAVAAAVQDALLTGGPTLARFEAALADVVGARHAIAVSSGTAALHTAYRAAGVGFADEVLTSSLTFVATANAAVYCGAAPRFADVDAHGALDATAVAAAVARHGTPRAVVPVHWAGHPAAVDAIAAAAPDAVVIEDACHALGASVRDASGAWRSIGDCGHSAMAVFSFHPVKTITTGEGGAVVTNDALLAARCRRFRDHGLVRDARERRTHDDAWSGPWSYEQHELGYNYRLTDLQAALGLTQLGRLEAFLAARRQIAAAYDVALTALPDVRPIGPPGDARSGWHLYPVRVPAASRRGVFMALRAEGIGVQVHYAPVHLQPYYRRRLGTGPGDCPAAEALAAEELSLPCFPGMTAADVATVVDALGRALTAPGGRARPQERSDAVHAG
jgi:UDP-4-amino-4,6-dideoxy-N-acetyl-beta-L-altrosamine transaminase